MTRAWWLRLETDILWHQTEGSGFQLTRADLLDMPVHELLAVHEDVHDRRRQEAEALAAASKRKTA